MASSNLLSGEFARRNKEHKPTNNAIEHKEPKQNIAQLNPSEMSNSNNLDWRTVFHNDMLLDPTATVESIDRKSTTSCSYLNHLIEVETAAGNEWRKFKGHLSNASSSVVSSLSSSRETSPHKSNASASSSSSMLFAKVPFGFGSNENIWLPPQIRTASISNLPVWNDVWDKASFNVFLQS